MGGRGHGVDTRGGRAPRGGGEGRDRTGRTWSVPIRDGDYWYLAFRTGPVLRDAPPRRFSETSRGAGIPLVPNPACPRRVRSLVDENEARGQWSSFCLADSSPRPTGSIAWARDTSGDERYTWVIQEASAASSTRS